jgi:hypothetical protein
MGAKSKKEMGANSEERSKKEKKILPEEIPIKYDGGIV